MDAVCPCNNPINVTCDSEVYMSMETLQRARLRLMIGFCDEHKIWQEPLPSGAGTEPETEPAKNTVVARAGNRARQSCS